jgi:hypothetical protein
MKDDWQGQCESVMGLSLKLKILKFTKRDSLSINSTVENIG